MKDETAKEVLIRLYGEKETYGYHQVLDAMVEYAIIKLEENHKTVMEILKGNE